MFLTTNALPVNYNPNQFLIKKYPSLWLFSRSQTQTVIGHTTGRRRGCVLRWRSSKRRRRRSLLLAGWRSPSTAGDSTVEPLSSSTAGHVSGLFRPQKDSFSILWGSGLPLTLLTLPLLPSLEMERDLKMGFWLTSKSSSLSSSVSVSEQGGDWSTTTPRSDDIIMGVAHAVSTTSRRCLANVTESMWQNPSMSMAQANCKISKRCSVAKDDTRWNSANFPALKHEYRKCKSSWRHLLAK
jgi:hypothetical protein